MLKKFKGHQKTLAEKVAESILHPNEINSASDTEDEATAAKITEFEDDEYELPQAASTEFRKHNVKLLSEQNEKYKGKIASRKDFESEDSDHEDYYENSDSSGNEEEEASFSGALKIPRNKQHSKIIDFEEQESEGEEEELDDDDNGNSELDSEDENEGGVVMSQVDHAAEIQKGLSVQNQLHIWERLLEQRINLQKILNKTNLLPPPQDLKDLEKDNNEYKDLKESTCKHTCQLLQNLLSLKSTLAEQFPEIATNKKALLKRSFPLEDHDLEEPPLKQVSQYLEDDHKQFRNYRNDVLVKWDDRTKLLQPGAGNKKKTFNEEYDIIRKIENTLVNKSLLIERSQQLKNSSKTETHEENTRNFNIYDDSDFYHQQLRELIEYKANITSNMSEVTKQFLELQKLRQKMKKKVDTRASKGRKLRYIVHNKLINFVAPNDSATWTTESVDELSKSLFV